MQQSVGEKRPWFRWDCHAGGKLFLVGRWDDVTILSNVSGALARNAVEEDTSNAILHENREGSHPSTAVVVVLLPRGKHEGSEGRSVAAGSKDDGGVGGDRPDRKGLFFVSDQTMAMNEPH